MASTLTDPNQTQPEPLPKPTRSAIRSSNVILEDHPEPCEAIILIEDGKIYDIIYPQEVTDAEILANIYDTWEVKDYKDFFIFPGLVDSNVHLHANYDDEWENIEYCTRFAASGGVTTIIDNPIMSAPFTSGNEYVDSVGQLVEKIKGLSKVDFGVMGILEPKTKNHLDKLTNLGVLGFKCFIMKSPQQEIGHFEPELLPKLIKDVDSKFPGTLLVMHCETATERELFLTSPCRAVSHEKRVDFDYDIKTIGQTGAANKGSYMDDLDKKNNKDSDADDDSDNNNDHPAESPDSPSRLRGRIRKLKEKTEVNDIVHFELLSYSQGEKKYSDDLSRNESSESDIDYLEQYMKNKGNLSLLSNTNNNNNNNNNNNSNGIKENVPNRSRNGSAESVEERERLPSGGYGSSPNNISAAESEEESKRSDGSVCEHTEKRKLSQVKKSRFAAFRTVSQGFVQSDISPLSNKSNGVGVEEFESHMDLLKIHALKTNEDTTKSAGDLPRETIESIGEEKDNNNNMKSNEDLPLVIIHPQHQTAEQEQEQEQGANNENEQPNDLAQSQTITETSPTNSPDTKSCDSPGGETMELKYANFSIVHQRRSEMLTLSPSPMRQEVLKSLSGSVITLRPSSPENSHNDISIESDEKPKQRGGGFRGMMKRYPTILIDSVEKGSPSLDPLQPDSVIKESPLRVRMRTSNLEIDISAGSEKQVDSLNVSPCFSNRPDTPLSSLLQRRISRKSSNNTSTISSPRLNFFRIDSDGFVKNSESSQRKNSKFNLSYKTFLANRPQSWEENAVSRILMSLKEGKTIRILLQNLSLASSFLKIRQKKKTKEFLKERLFCDTAAAYVFFNEKVVREGDTKFKVSPPFRGKENQRLLVETMRLGGIDTIGSYHFYVPPRLKNIEDGNFRRAFGGLESMGCSLQAAWTAIYGYQIKKNKRFTEDAEYKKVKISKIMRQLYKMMCKNPAKILKIDQRKGSICKGKDADFVIWDPYKVDDKHRLGYSHLFSSRYLLGTVHQTYLRGMLIYDRENGPQVIKEYKVKFIRPQGQNQEG